MYKDIINYRLEKDISEKHLLNVAKDIIDNWMSKQAGFISWEIHKNNDNGYTDIVCWKSKADAKQAEQDMANIPNAADWFNCYEKGSISSINLRLITKFE